VIIERDGHSKKQSSQIFSTDEGIQIDEIEGQCRNADLATHESLEPDSNVMVARESQP
jgi:hypothetical protein